MKSARQRQAPTRRHPFNNSMQREILDMDMRIATDEGPCRFWKPLRHELRGFWRYRVRDYRIICEIREHVRVIFG